MGKSRSEGQMGKRTIMIGGDEVHMTPLPT